MQVYVAGGWLEKDTIVAPMMARLRDVGVVITHDWTVEGPPTGSVEEQRKHESELCPAARRQHATLDLLGVANADAVWLIVPSYKGSAGSWVELGYALGLKKTIVVSGPWEKCIFAELATYKCALHEQGLWRIRDLALG